MKKFIAIVLLLSLAMTSCADSNNASSSNADNAYSSQISSQTVMYPDTSDLSTEFLPLENQPDKDALHIINTGYSDKKIYVNDKTRGYNNLKVVGPHTNTMTTICTKTDCPHIDENCNGYIPYDYEFISTWNNEYIIYKDITREEDYPFTQTAHYYRMDADGQNRKLLHSQYYYTIDFNNIILQQGNKLYFHIIGTGYFNGSVLGIGCLDIETGMYEEMARYESMYTEILGIYKDNLLICVNPNPEQNDYTQMSLYLLNIHTKNSECIYTKDIVPLSYAPEYNEAEYILYNGYVYEMLDESIFTINKINIETGEAELFYQNTYLDSENYSTNPSWDKYMIFRNIAIFRSSVQPTPVYMFAIDLNNGNFYNLDSVSKSLSFYFHETENSLLISAGSTEYFYSEEEKQKHNGTSNYYAYNYAFISKSDFLNGYKNYTFLQSAQ